MPLFLETPTWLIPENIPLREKADAPSNERSRYTRMIAFLTFPASDWGTTTHSTDKPATMKHLPTHLMDLPWTQSFDISLMHFHLQPKILSSF